MKNQDNFHTHAKEEYLEGDALAELKATLQHTIHHNDHHMEDFEKLIIKSETLGYVNVAGEIALAVIKLDEVNKSLYSALEMLK